MKFHSDAVGLGDVRHAVAGTDARRVQPGRQRAGGLDDLPRGIRFAHAADLVRERIGFRKVLELVRDEIENARRLGRRLCAV